jgi:Na+/H+-dicarboxylate symporter
LVALGAGIGIGLLLSAADAQLARNIIAVVEPVGTLFVNAIRMTVIPLVVSMLITGIATSGSGSVIARLGGRGILVFVILLLASGIVGAVVATPLLAHIMPDPAAISRLQASTASGQATTAGAVQSPSEWLVALVPPNVFRAAADGAMLPLIIFSLALGLALVSVAEPSRSRVVALFRGVAESMLVVVRWLMVVAPLGVFALTLPLVARLGLSAVGALATYVTLVSVAVVVFVLVVVYPAAALIGGVSLRDFARAAAPAQVVAISARSSLAALPALIESARTRLHLPAEISGFFLPLASAMFRVGATLGLTTGAVFIGRLYGVPISVPQLATIVLTSVVTSFSIPGIPGGSIIAMAPVLASVGLPVEGIGILLGVDTIPDMFRTAANVTGQLAAATIVARGARAEPSTVAAAPAAPATSATPATPVAIDV